MRCDKCNEREAVINLTQVEQDTKVTLHLCEQCAAEHGIESGTAVLQSPLGAFLASLGKETAEVAQAGDLRCERCGCSLDDFRSTGRLGCAECYTSFGEQLRDLLRRIHGSSQHTGEVYVAAGGGDTDRRRLLDVLRDELRRAVDAENFELAAELRDRIRILE